MNDCASPPTHDLLFVYGTLRRGCAGGPARRLAEESDWLGEAHVHGRLYRIDGYPGLVMAGTDNGRVMGDLIRLRDPAATLGWLDAYEETGAAFPEPWEYRRALLTATGAAGPCSAWTYIYNRPADGLERITGGNWLTE